MPRSPSAGKGMGKELPSTSSFDDNQEARPPSRGPRASINLGDHATPQSPGGRAHNLGAASRHGPSTWGIPEHPPQSPGGRAPQSPAGHIPQSHSGHFPQSPGAHAPQSPGGHTMQPPGRSHMPQQSRQEQTLGRGLSEPAFSQVDAPPKSPRSMMTHGDPRMKSPSHQALPPQASRPEPAEPPRQRKSLLQASREQASGLLSAQRLGSTYQESDWASRPQQHDDRPFPMSLHGIQEEDQVSRSSKGDGRGSARSGPSGRPGDMESRSSQQSAQGPPAEVKDRMLEQQWGKKPSIARASLVVALQGRDP